jgi:flagellar biogenesis protein FliO
LGSYAGYLVETLASLVGICALAFVILYGARRIGVGRSQGPISLVGQLPLDGRRSVYLVKVGAQVFVVGATEAGMTKLGEIAASELPDTRQDAMNAPFADVMARVLGREKDPK